jgi:hypothetical protein
VRAVEIAQAKRARLMTEVKRLDDFLSMAEALEREAAASEANLTKDLAPSPPNGHGLEPPAVAPTRSIRERVEEGIMAELKQYGARSTKELLTALLAKGIDPAPSVHDVVDKRNTLSTTLSKADLFVNDKVARVWRLAEPTKINKALQPRALTKPETDRLQDKENHPSE